MADFTKQSARWAIFNAIATALETSPQLQGVKVVRNPRTAQHLASGEQLVVIRAGTDSPIEAKGSLERRRLRVTVGSVSRKRDAADQDADAMHLAANDVVKRTLPTLAQLSEIDRMGNTREQDTTPDLDGIEIDGCLVLSAWEIDYQLRRAD